MSKTKNPLLSFSAQGTIGRVMTYVRRHHAVIVEKTPLVPDAKTLAQLSWRHMFLKVVALWHALTPQEQAVWESLARQRHLTGYQWFVSQALRPNPGIYLPLQGGTMQGDIDMASHKLEALPDPAAAQEAATKAYHDANLPAGGYTEGARVYHNVHQSIPTDDLTTLIFNSERYDTDAIHDNVTNNERLTCKTAGKYQIVAFVTFGPNAVGDRQARLMVNGVTQIDNSYGVRLGDFEICHLSSIWHLEVGDYLYLAVYQDSGGALDVKHHSAYSPEFMMQRIG